MAKVAKSQRLEQGKGCSEEHFRELVKKLDLPFVNAMGQTIISNKCNLAKVNQGTQAKLRDIYKYIARARRDIRIGNALRVCGG